MNILAVANQKGGVGKTTSAVTMAGILASGGDNVLIIDLDPHASMTSYFGIDPEQVDRGVYNLFAAHVEHKPVALNDVIHVTETENLYLMPSSSAVATLEKNFGNKNGMGLILSKYLRDAKDKYDHVIIDCPPVLGMLMINALVACEILVIPVQTETLAIKGLHRMLKTVEMIEHSLGTSINYSILPTMYDKRTLASKQSLNILHNKYGKHVYEDAIPVDTKFRDASFAGKPLSSISKSTHGLQAYEKYTFDILKIKAPSRSVA